MNGIKRHLGVFRIDEIDGKPRFSLREWGEPEEGMDLGI